MTVKELIEQLQQMPQTYETVTDDDGHICVTHELVIRHSTREVLIW